MPRPKKCRRVCDYPQTLTFLPEDHKNREQVVILTVDEYETIRLIDKEGLSQEQCCDFMQVARTTVQQIYASLCFYGLPAKMSVSGGNHTRACISLAVAQGIPPFCTLLYKDSIGRFTAYVNYYN